jgi:two-component system KDP operon response regulator KdpE
MVVDLPLVLILSSDHPMRKQLCATLQAAGYSTLEANSDEDAREYCRSRTLEALVIDLSSEERAVHELGNYWPLPLVAVSARRDVSEKIAALEAGADDHLSKPFEMDELVARLSAVRRRYRSAQMLVPREGDAPYVCGALRLDFRNRRVFLANRPVDLTPLEFRLLELLAKHAGKVLTQRFLLQEIWGSEHINDVNYLRVFVAGVRRKIEQNPNLPQYLLTERGIGYMLVCPDEQSATDPLPSIT